MIARSTPRAGKEIAQAGGEFALTWDDFSTIRDTLHADAGIVLDESKVPLVYSRLAKRLRSLGLESFRQYCALILSNDGVDERQKMLASLTTNVTRFFREPHHFEHLKSKVLPRLLSAAEKGAPVRIWSAGCSTGQEPYSIALTILGMLPRAPQLDIRILATDIDPNVVATARTAQYPDDLVSDIPADLRAKWMKKSTSARASWGMSDDAQELIRFRELNLIGNWPMKKKFDVIFCRNVVIYFNEDTQGRIWKRYADGLVERGTLYIGHSERVTGPATALFATDGLTTYSRRGA